VIGVDQEFKPDPVTADRKPYQSWYIRSSNGPDTLIGQYLDFSHGSFRYSQTFDMVGAIGGVKFDRFSSVNTDFFMQNIHIKGDILNATQSSQIRAFSFLGHDTIYNSLDITDMIRDDSTAGDLAWFIKDGTFDLNPFSMLNFYDHFMIYKDYQVGISYLYENYRPAQLLYNRVSRFAARVAVASSAFEVGSVFPGSDTSLSPGTQADPEIFFNRTYEGKPAAYVEPVIRRDYFSRLELAGTERFPLFGNKRHVATINAFFGTLDRKLPEQGAVYPLEYRAGMFMGGFPYSFDPIDTGMVIDSFATLDLLTNDSIIVYSKSPHRDKIQHDILKGNRIMYLDAEYTFEVARGITFRPLGLLFQGIYATAFAEAAGLWNSDILDFSLKDFLGTGGTMALSKLGKSYFKDMGLRIEIPFVCFENWHGLFSFTWSRRLNLDDQILRIDQSGNIVYLDKNRFYFNMLFIN
jgi:hypothetical protein